MGTEDDLPQERQCAWCGTQARLEMVERTYEVEPDSKVTVTNVPTYHCHHCGSVTFTTKVANWISRVVDS